MCILYIRDFKTSWWLPEFHQLLIGLWRVTGYSGQNNCLLAFTELLTVIHFCWVWCLFQNILKPLHIVLLIVAAFWCFSLLCLRCLFWEDFERFTSFHLDPKHSTGNLWNSYWPYWNACQGWWQDWWERHYVWVFHLGLDCNLYAGIWWASGCCSGEVCR